MKNKFTKVVSVLTVMAMLFSFVSVPVLAEEDTDIEIAEKTEILDVEEVSADSSSDENEEEFTLLPPDEEAFKAELRAIFDEATASDEATLFAEATLTGSGTEIDPYLIYTEAELVSFAVGNVAGGMSAHWSLMADIELTADTWAPVGAYDPFTGVFDGNGHTISSTKLFQSTAMSGIFGQNKGLIKNLNVNVTIEEVATNTGTLCATNYGTIENCHSTGSITTAENKYIGGLVGYNNGGTITNCSSGVLIDAPKSTVGGIAGYHKEGLIEYCASTADVEEADDGGLVGNYVGGIAGYMLNDNTSKHTKISNCYSLGKIKGGSKVGGITSYVEIGYYSERGYATIEYCYAKGVITAGSSTGGITSGISSQDKVLVKYSYYNNINSATKYGHGMSLLNYKNKANFYDWNFDNVWNIAADKNGGYPYIDLRGEEVLTIEGEGTAENPYIVTNEKQLCYIASEKIPNALNAHYKMVNDIVVTANFWTPIGANATNNSLNFRGVFDGNGYSITGVHLDNCYYGSTGLFGINYGTIKNLTVEGWFEGTTQTGIICGYNGNTGKIENCYTYIEDEDYKLTSQNSSGNVGGIAGISYGAIINCGSAATIETTANAGGLVGYLHEGKIEYSYATGDVTGKKAGGLVGYVFNDNTNTVATVSNCYAMGKVNGSEYAGGLVGYAAIGYYNERGYNHIEYSYARGLVSGGTNGGLVGGHSSREKNRIRYCYYNKANTGNRIGFAVSASDLKKEATFYGWDFENVWAIEKGVNTSYPHINVRGETPKTVLKGNGEEDNPYLIYTEEDLRALALDTYGNYDLSVKHFYTLMNDIEVTANFWTPIGANATNYFNGIFDGNGYTISGLKLSNSEYQYTGLFGYNTGTIKNLNVEGEFEGRENTGILCGKNSGVIDNCSSSGTVTSSITNSTDIFVGGLVGAQVNPGKISNSNSSATVNAPDCKAGGLLGDLNTSFMENCYATGNVTGKYAGGLIGYAFNDDSNVRSSIKNSYATGTVIGTEIAGGLVGYAGIGYYNERGYIDVEYCYATGLANNGDGGGLLGNYSSRDKVHVRYSYFNQSNKGNRIGFNANLDQMATEDLYYMWNFKNIWAIDPEVNNGYPYHNINGKIKTHYLDGYGDEEDPYMIETEEDLWALVIETYDLTTPFYYQLQDDIEITAQHWTPIGGNGRTVFKGVFDGNGYTISGLKLSDSELYDTGLFGHNAGTIKNLNVEGYFEGRDRTGILCGQNTGTIDNCSSSGFVETWLHGSDMYVGGLVGWQPGGKTINSSSSAKVDSYGSRTGGLIGLVQESLVENSYATGDVNGAYAGGLVGYLYNNNTNTTATIRNSFAAGNVTGETYDNGPKIYTGGLVSYTEVGYYNERGYTAIEFCYSNGTVTGTNRGGLVGGSSSAERNSILSSYYNSTLTGLSDIDRGTPLSNDALKIKDSFVGWDYDTVWEIDSDVNNGYPYLMGRVPEYSVDVTGVGLNKSEITLEEGKSEELVATVLPVNATNQAVTWYSANNEIATVANGVVVAKNAGTTTITVKTLEGGFTAECVVTVTEKATVDVWGVKLDNTELNLLYSEEATLTATVEPEDATNKSVVWSSDNTSVATVVGGKVTAKGAGTATITVTTVDGGFTAECVVTVIEEVPDDYIALDNIGDVTSGESYIVKGVTNLDTLTVAVKLNSSIVYSTVYTRNEFEQGIEITVPAGAKTGDTITVIAGSATTSASTSFNVIGSAEPEEGAVISIENVKAKAGETVEVDVVINENTGFANLSLEIDFDSDVLTLTNAVGNSEIGATFTKAPAYTNKPYNMSWDATENVKFNGTLATLTFKVNENAQDGEYEITVDYYKGINGNYTDGYDVNYDENFDDLNLSYNDGVVIVTSRIPGDVNGDGIVNSRDATFMLRYLAGWTIEGIDEDALDVDGSGTVNSRDATTLLRYLANWEVELH